MRQEVTDEGKRYVRETKTLHLVLDNIKSEFYPEYPYTLRWANKDDVIILEICLTHEEFDFLARWILSHHTPEPLLEDVRGENARGRMRQIEQ